VWGLYVFAGGLDIGNFIKTPIIYSVSYFGLGGLVSGDSRNTKVGGGHCGAKEKVGGET